MRIEDIKTARHVDLLLPSSTGRVKRHPVTFLRVEDNKVRVLDQRTGRILNVSPDELQPYEPLTPRQRRMIRKDMREQIRRGQW